MIQTILLLNALFEGGVGLIFILSPESVGLFAGADAKLLYMVRMYGFGAITIAFYSLKVWEKAHERDTLVLGLLVFTIFHLLIGIAQFTTSVDPATTYPPGVAHFIFAFLFGFSYYRER
ncbi:MAG: hypothetical protein MUE85_00025 [Microscillaceae bacterium]|jgi:hypothetical protein|nr:hypothetical protein [Microscillaceae bacterium]